MNVFNPNNNLWHKYHDLQMREPSPERSGPFQIQPCTQLPLWNISLMMDVKHTSQTKYDFCYREKIQYFSLKQIQLQSDCFPETPEHIQARRKSERIKTDTKNNGIRLPWWLSGKEFACQWQGHRFSPWCRKIPHAAQQLSPCAITTEPVLQSPGAATTEPMCRSYRSPHTQEPEVHIPKSPRSATREATAVRSHALQLESQPHSRQLEKVHTAVKTQHSQRE